MKRLAERKKPAERREIGSFFVKWHFFAPFFIGIFGLLAAFTFLFFTSMHQMFDFHKQRQTSETLDTLENAIAERQKYLHNYLSFIKDDADFKNAFYYATEDLISIKKPLADYLLKYKSLLGVDYVEALTADGKKVYAEEEAGQSTGGRYLPFKSGRLPPNKISTTLVVIDGTPHMAASIPVYSFDKLAGYLLVGFDFGLPFLEKLRGITQHEFFLLNTDGGMAVSTIKEEGFHQTLLQAISGRKEFPVELDHQGQRYFISALPMLKTGEKPEAVFNLYVVGNMSQLKAFQGRMILNAFLLFLAIVTAGFYISYLSSRILSRKINRILADLQDYQTKVEQQKKLSALGELAAQISHDIRSPLTALDSVTTKIAQLPEEQRLIVRSAVSRIHDIANHLLEKQRGEIQEDAAKEPGRNEVSAGQESVCLLSSLIAPVITEKRIQFRSRLRIEIDARLNAASYGHFARVAPPQFKRVLSNLINNSVEALSGGGTVTVQLTRDADWIVLRVEDDGKGIPPEIRERLGRRGESYGKPGGSGLGLYHAKTCLETWGGALEISSELGRGTVVSVKLPPAPPPPWFVSKLRLVPGAATAILDDDPTIHQVWQGRLESLGARKKGVDILHFSSAGELRAWVKANSEAAGKAIYLLDYELQGSTETGLTLAKELDLGERSILVTSRFEEKGILDECLRLKIRMIPKGLAGFVPVTLQRDLERPDGVLIEDDSLVQTVWKVAARTNGKTLKVFSHPNEFLAVAAELAKGTPIYVDSKLGKDIRGEEFAKELHARGFRNLYLATARTRESLPAMPWIKEVVGKEAPW